MECLNKLIVHFWWFSIYTWTDILILIWLCLPQLIDDSAWRWPPRKNWRARLCCKFIFTKYNRLHEWQKSWKQTPIREFMMASLKYRRGKMYLGQTHTHEIRDETFGVSVPHYPWTCVLAKLISFSESYMVFSRVFQLISVNKVSDHSTLKEKIKIK